VVLNIHSQLSLSNKSRISSETLGRSSSGNITVEAGAISIIDSALRAATAPESTGGNAGNIKVNVRDSLVISQLKPLSLQEFPVPVGISSSTNASGQGGQLEIFAGNSVVLSGFGNDSRTGLFAAATGAGFGGNLTLNTTELKVQNGSEISVSSSNPVTGKAGIINISARSIYLDNQGKITAKTISGNGGDIRLQVQDLFLMRHQSSISTSAGTGSNGGNGGNITINMPRGFLVTAPNENNDITANAFNGSGGKVEITAKEIYWFTPRSRADLVRLLGTNDPSKLDPRLLTSNNITAISQNNPNLNGTVAIAILGLDPSRGLLELPGNLVDPASLISQDCKPGNKQANSSFVDTGRGGLPANPMGMLGGEAVIRRLATLDPPAGSQSSGESSEDNSSESYSQGQRMPAIAQAAPGIVEAQGWIVRPDGVVVLVADPPTATPAAPMLATSSCQYR
jgi:large exoprotein involved in heme utilization and adhesion